MKRLPVLQENASALDQIFISTPCTVSWDGMKGSDLVRSCDTCRKNVYNISALTAREATRLIEANEGRACLRLFRRSDGTVVTSDCWARLKAARRRGWGAFVLMMVVTIFGFAWAQLWGWSALRGLFASDGCDVSPGKRMGTLMRPEIMGEMAVPVQPPPDVTMGVPPIQVKRPQTMGRARMPAPNATPRGRSATPAGHPPR